MTRSFTRRLPGMLFVAVALLAALAAPVATCAAQPGPSEAPSEPAASQPAPTTAPGDPGDGQGEVVIDGPFVTPTPEASTLVAGSEPRLTPPPTDVVPRTGPPPVDGTTRLLLLSGASFLALAIGTVRAIRARAASPATRTTPGRRTRR